MKDLYLQKLVPYRRNQIEAVLIEAKLCAQRVGQKQRTLLMETYHRYGVLPPYIDDAHLKGLEGRVRQHYVRLLAPLTARFKAEEEAYLQERAKNKACRDRWAENFRTLPPENKEKADHRVRRALWHEMRGEIPKKLALQKCRELSRET